VVVSHGGHFGARCHGHWTVAREMPLRTPRARLACSSTLGRHGELSLSGFPMDSQATHSAVSTVCAETGQPLSALRALGAPWNSGGYNTSLTRAAAGGLGLNFEVGLIRCRELGDPCAENIEPSRAFLRTPRPVSARLRFGRYQGKNGRGANIAFL
jgi:hypothetical protein